MKYPYYRQVFELAEEYARKSLEHTYSYNGWKNEAGTNAQYKRILTGRFGQEWTAEFCRLNKIIIRKDNSGVESADDFDLIIGGAKVDIKTSITTSIPRQVNGALRKKAVDVYCFLCTDKKYTFIEPLGFISKAMYFTYATRVEYDEYFPATRTRNKYQAGSYILKAKLLYSFEETLRKARRCDLLTLLKGDPQLSLF